MEEVTPPSMPTTAAAKIKKLAFETRCLRQRLIISTYFISPSYILAEETIIFFLIFAKVIIKKKNFN